MELKYKVREGNSRITAIAIPTCNRTDVLIRGLLSFADNCSRHERKIEFLVADDSTIEKNQQRNRNRLCEISKSRQVEVRYAGRGEKESFANQIVELAGVPRQSLATAVQRENISVYQGGKNYNAIGLQTAGTQFLCPDDDVICDVGILGEAGEVVELSSGRDPYQYYFAQSHRAAIAMVNSVDVDLIGLHQQFLGRDVDDLVLGLEESKVSTEPAAATRSAGKPPIAASENGRVVTTYNGLVGDCAWGAPFGYWGAPMGLLQLEGPSHQRLVRSEAAYRSACTSREIVRAVVQPTISGQVSCIGAIYGLCNRELLPPCPPWSRGHDVVFGLLLEKCVRGAKCTHLPQTLVHSPAETRRFWPGEICRTAAGYDLAKLMIDLIGEYDAADHLDTSDRMQGLGNHLKAIGGMTESDFAEHVWSTAQATALRTISAMDAHLRANDSTPAYWARDVQRYIDILGRSMKQTEYWTPLDLAHDGDLDHARKTAQQFVMRFGEALYYWPAIVAAAKQLRERGNSMGVRL